MRRPPQDSKPRDRQDRGPRRRTGQRRAGCTTGFTITELLVVVGLIAVLISLLLPVLGRVRAAANSATCLANLRQMNTAWHIYLVENRGRLPHYAQSTPSVPEIGWRSYWPGVLETYRVQGDALLCPAAREPIPYNQAGLKGSGNVNYAWSGKWHTPGTVARLNSDIYRTSSYGYNDRLTPEGKFDPASTKVVRISQIKNVTEVPVFFDCSCIDAHPENWSVTIPAQPPHDLHGELPVGAPDHWRFLIARHGRAINVGFADGSARRVPLEETYMLQWAAIWEKYRLTLPPF